MSGHAIAFLGASGRIGTLMRVAEQGRAAAHTRYVWQFRKGPPHAREARFVWPDFSDPSPFLKAVEQHRVQTLCVFTGATENKSILTADAEAHTHMDTLATVEQALRSAQVAGVSRVLVASSSAVYGPGHGAPFSEVDAPAPHSEYGRTKLAVEEVCAQWREASDLKICALRIGNVAGADMLLGAAPKNSSAMRDLDIFPDGAGPRRSYIGPSRLFEILTALADYRGNLPSVLNVGGQMPVTMNALLDSADLPWRPRPRSDTGHQNIVLNCDCLAALCPDVDLRQDAADIVADWRATTQKVGA